MQKTGRKNVNSPMKYEKGVVKGLVSEAGKRNRVVEFDPGSGNRL